MANRNDSDVRQHETLPGPGPGPNSSLPAGARPVEQMVDAAIERIAREHGLSTVGNRSGGDASSRDHASHERTGSEPAYPLALPMQPTRLRWKGLDVSEEFKAYADRVGRGEDLPPFEGRVLAEPNPAFPWGPSSAAQLTPVKGGSTRVALWGSALVVLGLLGWSVEMKLEADARDDAASSAALERAFATAPADGQGTASTGHAAATGNDSSGSVSSDPVPHDVVETQVTARTAAATELGTAEPSAGEPASDEDDARNMAALDTAPPDSLPANMPPGVAHSAPATGSPSLGGSVAGISSGAGASAHAPLAAAAASSAPAPSAASAASASVAPAGTSLAPRAASAVEPAHAAGPKPLEDDFGIEAAPAAAKPAPAVGASVGDLARAGQGSGANVRKEPGSESSAKGSLLVENPSF